MIKLLLRELRNKRFSLAVYCILTVLLILMYTALFPSLKAQADELAKAFESIPKGVFQAIGVETIEFKSLQSFLSLELFSITWPILCIVLAVSRAGSAIADEIDKGTMGTLLALPVRRSQLYLSKYLAGVISIAVYVVFSVLVIIPIAFIMGISTPSEPYLRLAVLAFFFGTAVLSLSYLFSAVFSDKGKVYAISGGLLLIMYIMNIVSGLTKNLAWLEKLSLFHYFDAPKLLSRGVDSPMSYAVFSIIIASCAFGGMIYFSRRDIAV